MKIKTKRLEAIRTLISNNELGSQNEILDALRQQGFELTQATLSRDMKQLKIAKAASMNGKYVYVLPNETMYRRVHVPISELDLAHTPGFLSINFSGNIAVIHTRPGYARVRSPVTTPSFWCSARVSTRTISSTSCARPQPEICYNIIR